jgi:hypothetical protein
VSGLDADAKALLPSGFYVVVKRFSAKEERRRIVAAVWDPTLHGASDGGFACARCRVIDSLRGGVACLPSGLPRRSSGCRQSYN